MSKKNSNLVKIIPLCSQSSRNARNQSGVNVLAKDMTKHPESSGERGSQIGARFPPKEVTRRSGGGTYNLTDARFQGYKQDPPRFGLHTHTLGRRAAYANFGSWDPKIADRSCRSRHRRRLGPTPHGTRGKRGAKVRFFTVNLLLHRHQVPRGEILLAWREVRNYRHSSDLCNSILFAGSRASHMVDYFLL